MNLSFKTKGDAPVSGKQLIFLHAMPQDGYTRDRVIKMILESEQGYAYAVVYPNDEGFPLDFDSYELARMSLYMPLITVGYLSKCPPDFDMDRLQSEHGIMVLPVVENADLIVEFSTRFNDAHAVTLSMENPAYEIEKQLTRMLISADLNEEIIKDAFTRKLFISYRKKDKAEIGRIMSAVRGTRWAASAAFWFDDFLVPGTDFEEGINDAMAESDAVVLAVTPSLTELNDLGEKNYVCAHEYPDAVDQGKTIIPVEAIPTNRAELESEFDEIPPCVPIYDEAALDEEFSKLGDAEPEADPYIKYLRAMAFLSGMRVEKDPARAVAMLDECANLGVPEAAYQLAYMYSFGISVPEDLRQSILYKQQAYHIVDSWDDSEEKFTWLAKILYNEGKDPFANIGLNNDDADTFYQSFLDEIEEYSKDTTMSSEFERRLKLWMAEAHISLANVEDRTPDEIRRMGDSYISHHLYKAGQLLESIEDSDIESLRVSAVYHSIRCSYYREKNDFKRADDEVEKAYRCQQQVVELDPSFEARWQLATYQMNRIGCSYLLYCENPPSDPDYRRAHLASFDRMCREAIEAAESLYAERKHPKLATEIVMAYQNRKIAATNGQDRKQWLLAAQKRYEELAKDYPFDRELELAGADVAADLSKPGFVPGVAVLGRPGGGALGETPAWYSALHTLAMAVHIIVCMYISVQSSLIVGGNVLSSIPQDLMILGGAVIFDRNKAPIHIVADAMVAAVLFRIISAINPASIPFGTEGVSILLVVIAVFSTIL